MRPLSQRQQEILAGESGLPAATVAAYSKAWRQAGFDVDGFLSRPRTSDSNVLPGQVGSLYRNPDTGSSGVIASRTPMRTAATQAQRKAVFTNSSNQVHTAAPRSGESGRVRSRPFPGSLAAFQFVAIDGGISSDGRLQVPGQVGRFEIVQEGDGFACLVEGQSVRFQLLSARPLVLVAAGEGWSVNLFGDNAQVRVVKGLDDSGKGRSETRVSRSE